MGSSQISSTDGTAVSAVSPYVAVEMFLRRYADASSDDTLTFDGRSALSDELEFPVTEADYRMLTAPLFYIVNAERRRPSDSEIAEHSRWWLNQLP